MFLWKTATTQSLYFLGLHTKQAKVLQSTRNALVSLQFISLAVDFDLIAISFSAVLALGAIWLLSSFFEEDDDDQNGGGLGSPIYAGNPA